MKLIIIFFYSLISNSCPLLYVVSPTIFIDIESKFVLVTSLLAIGNILVKYKVLPCVVLKYILPVPILFTKPVLV